jgi:hypothetical protein
MLKGEKRCGYDGVIESIELVTCSEGYGWRVHRGGLNRLGDE